MGGLFIRAEARMDEDKTFMRARVCIHYMEVL